MEKIIQTDRAELKKFGIMFMKYGPLFGAAALVWGLWQGHTFPKYAGSTLLAGALYSVLTTFTMPILLFPLYVVFTTIGNVMQWVINIVMLSFVYYLLLTPFAILFRIVKRDPLQTRLDPDAASYWEKKEAGNRDIKRYEKQF